MTSPEKLDQLQLKDIAELIRSPKRSPTTGQAKKYSLAEAIKIGTFQPATKKRTRIELRPLEDLTQNE